MVFYNTAYLMMFGPDESFLLNKPTLFEIMDDLRDRRRLPEYTDFRAHKDGRKKLFNSHIEPIMEIMHQPDGVICRLVIAPMPGGGLAYLFDDITDKLSLERRYNTLAAVQKETIDHLYEGVIVFGTDYRLRLSNPAMGKIWGIETDEHVEGTHINDMLKVITPQFKSPKASKLWRAKMLDVVSRRHPERQRIILKKDKVLEYSYVPLPDGCHLVSFVDVSNTWRFENILKQRNQELEHEDYIKTNFISHISYELQSPLHAIAGFSELLANQYFGTLNEKQLDYVKGIVESTDRLINLMNDMLELANIESGTVTLNYQAIDVDTLLKGVVALIQNRANDHGLELIVDNQMMDQTMLIDVKQIKHVLFNLLTNAVKFTPGGGRITLKAVVSQTIHCVDLIVEDTGIGIKESDCEQICKLFGQDIIEVDIEAKTDESLVSLPDPSIKTKKRKNVGKSAKAKLLEATEAGRTEMMHETAEEIAEDALNDGGFEPNIGLGLTLVRRLIELHGGKVHLTSTLNVGTRVQCTLPLLPPDYLQPLETVTETR
jgi:signal transduction histidine kinase